MRTPIQNRTIIRLNEVGTDKKYDFKIKEMIGMGGSCIVYTAVYTDPENNHFSVRLKELYPEWLDIERESLAILVPDEKSSDFAEAMQQFTEGYKKQMQFRELPESMNSIANIQGIYEGNNTKYIAMSCQNAVPLSADMSLYDVFRVIRAVTLQIAGFHDNGYLYLDLKPQNIMLYPETPEMVMLFDFDSAVPIDDIQPAYLSCTDSWASPEILQRKIRDIGVEADIYGIGAIMLYLLFDRVPKTSDRRRGASWDNEIENSLLKTEKPETKRTIKGLLSNTLAADPKKRYSSCDDLLDVIEPLITEYQKPKPYLKTFLPMGNNFFCGRDNEIAEIHESLQVSNLVVLHGIGGIGKSELAKHFALEHSNEYDAVVFVRFQKDIFHTIISDSSFPIVNCKRSEDENDEKYFERKISILRLICTSRHLILLDNFDVDECEDMNHILGLQCKVIVTSRCDHSDYFRQIEIDVLEDDQDLSNLVMHYYKAEHDEDDMAAVTDIIEAVQGHTMALELIAKHMQEMGISPVQMREQLAEKGIVAGGSGNVKNLKDGNIRKKSAYDHISALFSIFGLSEDIKQILRYSALIGPYPISLNDYDYCCDLTDTQFTALESAVKRGWIQAIDVNDGTSYLTLHPLISDVLCNELKPDVKHCEHLILAASVMTDEICNYNYDERVRTILWLDHIVHNIHGNSPAITKLLDDMCVNVYYIDLDYTSAEWCHKTIIKMIYNMDEQDNYKLQLLNSYLFLRCINKIKNDNMDSDLYFKEIRELDTPIALSLLLEENCNIAIENDNYELAMELSQERFKLACDQNDEYIAKAYNQLGEVELKFGKRDTAHDYYTKAAEYMEKWVHERETDIELLSDEIARLYRDTGDMNYFTDRTEKALVYYNKAIEVFDTEYGENNTNSAEIYSLISDVYYKLDNKDKQIEYLKKAVSAYAKVYGREHTETIQMYEQLYQAYFDELAPEVEQSDLKEAADISELLVDIASDVYGKIHFITAKYYKQCSTVYKYMGNKEKCYHYTELTIKTYDKLCEDNDPDLIYFYNYLADGYIHFGDTDLATDLLRKALLICEKIDDTEQLESIQEELTKIMT